MSLVKATCILAVVFLCLTVPGTRAQKKCMTPELQADVDTWQPGTFDLIIAYNITQTKISGQTCGEILDYFGGLNKENGTIYYKVGGTTFQDSIKFFYEGTSLSYTYNTNPGQKLNAFSDASSAPVLVMYICNGDAEQIWIGYPKGSDVSKEAEAKAKELTANPDDYKLDPKGCL